MPEEPLAQPSGAVIRRGLWLLGRAVREQPRIYAIAVAGSAVYALLTVAQAYALGWVTGHVIVPSFRDGRTTAGALAAGAALIVGLAVVKSAGVVVRRVGAGTMQYRLQADYRRRVTRQYLRLPLAWHQRWPTGTLLSNANSDVEAMWWTISPFPLACGVVLMLLTTAVLVLVTDWVLAIIGFVVFPLVAILTYVYGRALAPRAARAQRLRGEVSAVAHESFDGGLVVKTLGREADETDRFAAKAQDLREANVALGRLRGLFDPALEALPNLAVLLVLLVGTVRLQHGDISASQLVQVAYLFTLLAFPIRAIGWVFADLPRAVAGWERVDRVLTATGSMAYGAGPAPDGTGPATLELRGTSYAYRDGEEVSPALHDVTLDVPAGRTVAVVGPTGSGKSTLTTLLVRLVDPDDGAVLLDSTDLRDLAAGGVSSIAALVAQQTFLFDDTVRGNVTLGAEVPEEEVWAALAVAQADRFVQRLPEGLDSRIGERGTTLSGGQRQRLALARALVRRPRLLVLDDATSSVDPAVEQAILAGLRAAGRGAAPSSVVVIAYRRSTITLADEVVYVERGRVLARGSHEELLVTTPGYRQLITAYERAQAERLAAKAEERDSERDEESEPAA
ncbi:MAG: ABC transporter ATP-binding protein [Frankiaceae bacterium]